MKSDNRALDAARIKEQAAKFIAQDKDRYDRVMAEIDADERQTLERLKSIRERRAVVKLAGHLK
jgi:hypothetical protein